MVEERGPAPFKYELRHRRLAAEALRELRRARAGCGEPVRPLATGLPNEPRLVDAEEPPEPLDP